MGNLNDDKVRWKLIHHVEWKVTFCILTRNINFHHLSIPTIYIVEHALKFVITSYILFERVDMIYSCMYLCDYKIYFLRHASHSFLLQSLSKIIFCFIKHDDKSPPKKKTAIYNFSMLIISNMCGQQFIKFKLSA